MDQRDCKWWRSIIEQSAAAADEPIVEAQTFGHRKGGYDSPALLFDDQSRGFYVKGKHIGRSLVTEHVVARLGQLIDAPVVEVALVNVSSDLIDYEPKGLDNFGPGLGHGSKEIVRVSEERMVIHEHQPENRPRYASLAVLYGWAIAGDHQFLFDTIEPFYVHSHDHGYFLPDGPDWSPRSLKMASPPTLDHEICRSCNLKPSEISFAMSRLKEVTDEQIARVVAVPPDEWGISMRDRIALCEYFSRRREQLLSNSGD